MNRKLIATTCLLLSISVAEAQTPSVVRNTPDPAVEPTSVVRMNNHPSSEAGTQQAPAPSPEDKVPLDASAPLPETSPLLSAVKACTPLVSPQGVTRTFNASVNVAAHLIFPLPIASAHISTSVWTEDHHDNSVWIRPTQASHLADTVGLTVIMTDGRQFDYTVKSVAEPTNCYLIVPFPFVSPDASSLTPEQLLQAKKILNAIQAKKNAHLQEIASIEARIRAEEEANYQKQFYSMKQQVMSQAEDRIKEFQMAIHTHYEWSNHDLIPSVYDDGSTTYIRAVKTGYGTPILTGKHNGKAVALQYDYDDLTGVYVISGLYDKIDAVLGSNHVLIKRKG